MEGIGGVATRLQAESSGSEYEMYRRPGILAHTFSGTLEVSLNGRKVPEGGFAGATAGDLCVLLHEVRRIDGQTVQFHGADMPEVSRFFEVVHHMRPPE